MCFCLSMKFMFLFAVIKMHISVCMFQYLRQFFALYVFAYCTKKLQLKTLRIMENVKKNYQVKNSIQLYLYLITILNKHNSIVSKYLSINPASFNYLYIYIIYPVSIHISNIYLYINIQFLSIHPLSIYLFIIYLFIYLFYISVVFF